MQRRLFLTGLSGILASGFAPAAIGSSVLMPTRQVLAANNTFFHNGEDSDREVFEKFLDGDAVYNSRGQRILVIDSWEVTKMNLGEFAPGQPIIGLVDKSQGCTRYFFPHKHGLELAYPFGTRTSQEIQESKHFSLVQHGGQSKQVSTFHYPRGSDKPTTLCPTL